MNAARATDGVVVNRYKNLTNDFRELVDKELSMTDDNEPMWRFEILENEQRTLLPRNVQGGKKKARLGSMEVILSWKSAGDALPLPACLCRAPCPGWQCEGVNQPERG